MDWTILIDAAIGLITPLVWAISLRIAWPAIVNIIKEWRKKDKDKNEKDNH